MSMTYGIKAISKLRLTLLFYSGLNSYYNNFFFGHTFKIELYKDTMV